jgi:hypothetical protein
VKTTGINDWSILIQTRFFVDNSELLNQLFILGFRYLLDGVAIAAKKLDSNSSAGQNRECLSKSLG